MIVRKNPVISNEHFYRFFLHVFKRIALRNDLPAGLLSLFLSLSRALYVAVSHQYETACRRLGGSKRHVGKHRRVTTVRSAPEERMRDGRDGASPEPSRASLSPEGPLATKQRT